MAEFEFWDAPDKPLPDGYEFVPAGDHFVSKTIRSLCKECEFDFYTEMRKSRRYSRPVGYHVPSVVVAEARKLREETQERRAVARAKSAVARARRETRYKNEFAQRIVELFPGIPTVDAEAIAKMSCEVGSERVGRTKMLELDKKVELAVTAHARHNYTDYEEHLEDVSDTDEYIDLRREIREEVDAVLDKWRMPVK